jgi:hypothetical protein
MTVVTLDEAVAQSGNKRLIAPPWWRCALGANSDVLFRYMAEATVRQYVETGCPLTDDQEQMLLAVHEVGHTFAMHAVDLEYGEITINPQQPESSAGGRRLRQLARAQWCEPPRTAHEVAVLALGGWVASETWMDLTTVNGKKLRDNPLNVCRAQVAAADDHYDLMRFPTPRATAYLYGQVPTQQHWDGDVIMIEQLTQAMIVMYRSRWSRVIELTESVLRDKGATVQAITNVLGTPGWARQTA